MASNWDAPAFSDSLSNLISRRMLRAMSFRRYAITHPANAMITNTISRGRKRAKSFTSSCIALISSLTIISRMMTSLSVFPQLQQIRFQALELQT